jgi:thiosulfate dehydrogenase
VRGFLLGLMTAIVIAVGGAYFIVTSGGIPANADGPPLPFEEWAARNSLSASLAKQAPKGANPVALTDENLVAGIGLFGQHCVICHGNARGIASTSDVAKGLNPSPPQLATDGVEDDPEGATFWKLQHGIRWTAMPSWKDSLSEKEMWTLALFLKHMDKLPPAAEQAWQQVK